MHARRQTSLLSQHSKQEASRRGNAPQAWRPRGTLPGPGVKPGHRRSTSLRVDVCQGPQSPCAGFTAGPRGPEVTVYSSAGGLDLLSQIKIWGPCWDSWGQMGPVI